MRTQIRFRQSIVQHKYAQKKSAPILRILTMIFITMITTSKEMTMTVSQAAQLQIID